jgi:hypothetical protein
MYQDLSAAAAKAHRSDLRCEASRSRLVALATCCRPSTWKRRLLNGDPPRAWQCAEAPEVAGRTRRRLDRSARAT